MWEVLRSFERKPPSTPEFEEVKEKTQSKEKLNSDGTWEGGESEESLENLRELKKTIRLGLILMLVCVGYVTLSRLALAASENTLVNLEERDGR